jgi:hypothetical protein
MPWTHPDFWLLPLIIAALLGLLSYAFSRGRLLSIYKRQFQESRRERRFLASVGFFTTALVVRGITIAIHNDIGPFHNVTLHGRHIHHLVWGILLLLIVGYFWLNEFGTGVVRYYRWTSRFTSMLYGVGAALTLDEFALWLNLKDVYWQREGHESYEALALFGGVLMTGVFGGPLFRGLGREAVRPFRRSPRDLK